MSPNGFADELMAARALMASIAGHPPANALQLYAENDEAALELAALGCEVSVHRRAPRFHGSESAVADPSARRFRSLSGELSWLPRHPSVVRGGERHALAFCVSALWRHLEPDDEPQLSGREALLALPELLCAGAQAMLLMPAALAPIEPRVRHYEAGLVVVEQAWQGQRFQSRYRFGSQPQHLRGPDLDCAGAMAILRSSAFERVKSEPLDEDWCLLRATMPEAGRVADS